MQQRSGSTLKGLFTISLLTVNVIAWCLVLFTVALLKFFVPVPASRKWASRAMTALAEGWIGTNNALFRAMGALPLDTRGFEGLSTRDWYLVVSNHRSWVDILVLQAVFNRRIPFLKFFLKQQLIWVPFLGVAWWALDFPFMRRYSPAYLEKHPEHRGKDLEVTRRACGKFRVIPTSVMNFVEGTRYTPQKHAALDSPYRNLLPPRPGGVSFVLSAMGGTLHSMLDVTIVYTSGTPSLWDLCCGRVSTVIVDLRRRAIEAWIAAGDYAGDPAFRERFKTWLGGIWADKDRTLESLLGEA
ncbi:MAG: acyltransferase [Steroidobacteraceae bacterium]|nr:acyltransferase [Steroidobacteraceae bacterium]